MNNDGGKKKGKVRAIAAFLLVMSIALGVWAFYNVKLTRSSGTTYIYDGWVFGREDQKKASAALAEAGLNDYFWRDGKLAAPADKKGEFQRVLASAGAYPKAPSELRVDAIREMSVFESESKTRYRELSACAQQLERTIEQMRGVEDATVAVRSRREQVGLTAKNIITASVGVVCSKDRELDMDVLSAITVATKHQLGIDDVANISIIDLKEGKSYFGSENAVGSGADVALASEKERIEKYWRDKFLEAFGDIKNLRISVVADVTCSSDESLGDRQNEKIAEDSKSPILPTSFLEISPQGDEIYPVEPRRLISAPVKGRFETLDNLAEEIGKQHDSNTANHSQESVEKPRFKSQKESADWNGSSNGFALLGNPTKSRIDATGIRKQRTKVPVESGETSSSEVVSVNSVARFCWIECATPCNTYPVFSSALGDGHVLCDRLKTDHEKNSPNVVANWSRSLDSFYYLNTENEDDCAFKPLTAVRQVGRFVLASLDGNEGTVEASSSKTILRSIAVHIAVPKSYLQNVASHDVSAPETFASDREAEVLAEIKRCAIDLFRPTGERLGWNEREFERWFVVSAFSDVDGNAVTSRKKTAATPRSRYSVSYVEKSDEGPSSSLGEISNDSSNNVSHYNEAVPFADYSDVIAEISQTVASGTETLAPEGDDETVDFQRFFKNAALLGKVLESSYQNPLYRNIGVGAIASVLCLCCIFWANRRFHKKRTYRIPANSSRDKKDDAGKGSVSHKRRRFESQKTDNILKEDFDGLVSDLDECDDELDNELQKMVATREISDGNRARSHALSQNDSVNASDVCLDKRREVLDIIAKYPERAASTLQNWVRNA